jgi:uncharacterized protein YkwD
MHRFLLGTLGLTLSLAVGLPPAPAEGKKEGPAFKPTPEEKTLLDLVNKERARAKLPTLESSPLLYQIARAHARNMARQGKMSHVLDGKRPKDRALEAGYDYRFIGENVAYSEPGSDEKEVPLADIHASWMKSKVHRDNILSKNYRETGLGLARTKKGEVYYAQVFGTSRKRP